jgi:hypothetical protein
MMFEFNPSEFFQNKESFVQAEKAAKSEGLPLVVYALKYLDKTFAEKAGPAKASVPAIQFAAPPQAKTSTDDKNILEIKTNMDFETPLDSLGVTGYCLSPLQKAGFVTIGDIVAYSKEKDLSEINRFGLKSQTELRERLLMTEEEEEEEEEDRGSFEEDEEEGGDVFEDEDDDYYDEMMSLSPDSKMLVKALALYKKAWGLEDEDAKKQLSTIAKGSGFKTSDLEAYPELLKVIGNNMPPTFAQLTDIESLSKVLGEDYTKFTQGARVQAIIGTSWKNMRYEDAKILMAEMRKEVIEMGELTSDEEEESEAPAFHDDDDFFATEE